MNELQLFNNPDFGEIRALELDGQPWFVGKDVAAALGYERTTKAIQDHVDDEDKDEVPIQDSIGRMQKTPIINESGLYSLVLSSKLPGAKQFKRWVTSEVLPSIRNNGGYINGQETMSPEELMAKALMVAEKTLAEREKRISALTVENQILQPKADYFDQLVDRNLLTSLRDTAKELGIKEKKFIGFLVEKKYLYRDKKGKLTPYAGKADDLFTVKEFFNEKTNWSGTQTMVTPKGRETFKLLCEGM